MSRATIHLPANIGEKIANDVASGMGSWYFVIAQTGILVAWIILNSVGWFIFKWDAYPFIAMNLLLSCQAAYAAPLILMSSNRAAVRDKKRDDLESDEVQSLFDNHLLLLKINDQQLEILKELRGTKTTKVK
jgi:uncharacterized membrane protein